MTAGPYISRFTPTLMTEETLEAIFVARRPLLSELQRRVAETAGSPTRNHTLLVGPRGSGKTHLLAMLANHIRHQIASGLNVQLAQLPEDPWEIINYNDLLLQITRALHIDVNRGTRAGDLEAKLRLQAAQRGTIVVLLENLDLVLNTIGNAGQQSLRHFLQDSDALLLIATTSMLDRSLNDQDSPFYGFFTTTSLPPLTAEQARDMLVKIARSQGQDDLTNALNDEAALARIKAVAQLTGSQPRAWAALASSLAADGLDDIAAALLRAFDDLTPYYQDQLRSLSPQQRTIVAELARTDHAMHVAEIAEHVAIGQRATARSLGELITRGWVKPVQTIFTDLMDQRRTYYELSEPLARLSFQVKDSSGEPISMIIDFLTLWLDDKWWADSISGDISLKDGDEKHACDGIKCSTTGITRLCQEGPSPSGNTSLPIVALADDALSALLDGNAELFIGLPTSLRECLFKDNRFTSDNSREQMIISNRIRLHQVALGLTAFSMGNAEKAAPAQLTSLREWMIAANATSCSDDRPTSRPELAAWTARAESLAQQSPLIGRIILSTWLRLNGANDEADIIASHLALPLKD